MSATLYTIFDPSTGEVIASGEATPEEARAAKTHECQRILWGKCMPPGTTARPKCIPLSAQVASALSRIAALEAKVAALEAANSVEN